MPKDVSVLQARLASHWQWEPQSSLDGAPQRIRLTARKADLRTWSVIVPTVAEIEKLDGVVIESIEVSAEGAGPDRHFTRISVLRLTGGNPGNESGR